MYFASKQIFFLTPDSFSRPIPHPPLKLPELTKMASFIFYMIIEVTISKEFVSGHNPVEEFVKFNFFRCWSATLWAVARKHLPHFFTNVYIQFCNSLSHTNSFNLYCLFIYLLFLFFIPLLHKNL